MPSACAGSTRRLQWLGLSKPVAGAEHNHEPFGHEILDEGRAALLGLPRGINSGGSWSLVASGFITTTDFAKTTSLGPCLAIPSARLGKKRGRPSAAVGLRNPFQRCRFPGSTPGEPRPRPRMRTLMHSRVLQYPASSPRLDAIDTHHCLFQPGHLTSSSTVKARHSARSRTACAPGFAARVMTSAICSASPSRSNRDSARCLAFAPARRSHSVSRVLTIISVAAAKTSSTGRTKPASD